MCNGAAIGLKGSLNHWAIERPIWPREDPLSKRPDSVGNSRSCSRNEKIDSRIPGNENRCLGMNSLSRHRENTEILYQTITYLFRRDIGESIRNRKTCIQVCYNEAIFITTRSTEWSNGIEYKMTKRRESRGVGSITFKSFLLAGANNWHVSQRKHNLWLELSDQGKRTLRYTIVCTSKSHVWPKRHNMSYFKNCTDTLRW